MKVKELIEAVENKLEIYHSTTARFKKFNARPTWFALNKKDALNWHKGHPNSVTVICSFAGKIATEQEGQ